MKSTKGKETRLSIDKQIEAEADVGSDIPTEGKISETPQEFHHAVQMAQMNGEEYVEVSEKMFKYLTKGSDTAHLDWGTPSIKVFKAGDAIKYMRDDGDLKTNVMNPDEAILFRKGLDQ